MKDKVYLKDFFNLLIVHKKAIFIIMLTSLLCLVQLSFILPKTYKSEFEINIYSKYFKNALINDVIPGMNSIIEMTQTTDSMVKETLNDRLIDEIGYEYNIYSKKLNLNELSKARESLRSRFELFSTGGQSYKVAFSYSDPFTTFAITKKVLGAVKGTFINTRLETIQNARETIQKKLKTADVTKQISEDSISSNVLASKNPDALRTEIVNIDSDLNALKMEFNLHHPQITKLQHRKETIENWLKEIDSENISSGTKSLSSFDKNDYSESPLLLSNDNQISQNITAKLYIKFNDINLALDIERKNLNGYIGVIVSPQLPTSPLFPKRRLFASLGFILGLVICFGYVLFIEILKLSSIDKAKLMAKNLNCEYFGIIPFISENGLMTNNEIKWKLLSQDEFNLNHKTISS